MSYVFKHICSRLLGVEVKFATVIEEFISHPGPKMSYGKQPMGNELFVQSHGLLSEQGLEAEDIVVKDWKGTKCFFATSDKSAIPFDVFAASFYLLSRYEEYLPHVKDEKGRYPASESLGAKHGFLEQPVVDIWAHYFKEVLLRSFPEMKFVVTPFSIHTVLMVNATYAFKQKGLFRTVVDYVRDFAKLRFRTNFRRTAVLLGFKKDPNDVFNWLIESTKGTLNLMTTFFMLGETPVFSEGINTGRKKFMERVKFVADYHEVGIILSPAAQKNYEVLKEEVNRMEAITNKNVTSAISYDFYVQLPFVYRSLVEMEVAQDYTMAYEDVVGFRAGTCSPFLFYDLDYEIKTPLRIHPLAATTRAFREQSDAQIQNKVDDLKTSVHKVNGTFSMLFYNTDFVLTFKNRVWRTIFTDKLKQYEG